ncbi:MAG TPA: PAS domain S-box protein, partial [Candidatus Eisenbacteria bacterium]|nr:PAS domain S-box protein [Candidatus Eisenbacteria bacterium]
YHIVHIVGSLIGHLDPPLVVIILREVTDLVRAQEELEAYRDHLEEIVDQRTEELSRANEVLQQEVEVRQRIQLECHELSCRFEKVVAEMPVMLDAFDEKGVIVSWNRECERVTGYGAEELVGNPRSLEMLYPDPAYRREILKTLESLPGNLGKWEFELTCKDGSKKTIVWSNVSSRAPIPGWYTWAIGVDVTERKRMEEALRRSEERMRAQYMGIPVPTYTWQERGGDFVLIEYNDAADSITNGLIRELIGVRASAFFRDEPGIIEEMRRCHDERATIQREMEFRFKKAGKTLWFDVKYAHIPPDIVIVHTADITERKKAEEELERYRKSLERLVDERTRKLQEVNERLLREIAERERTEETLEKRNRELAVLNEAYRVIATSTNTEEILERILVPIMEFCGAGMGALFLLDYESNDMALISSVGIDDEIARQVKRVSMDVGSIKQFMSRNDVFVAEEDMSHPDSGKYEHIKESLGIKKTMAFFISSHGRLAYMVMMGRREDDLVPPGIRSFVEIVGHQISLAVERLELLEALDRSKNELKNLAANLIGSIEEERRQIALSLHDETSQTLAAAKNDLELLKGHISGGGEESERLFQDVRDNLLKITESTRRISYSLHPAMLEDLGLIPAINWYAEKFARSKKLRVEIESVGFDREPPQHIALTLYRVAQEALSNVVRHADAERAVITITKGYPNIIMIIEDDGKGFAAKGGRIRGAGLGIIGMRERVEGMGGRFIIRSEPGKGTRIRVTIPLEVENNG